MFVYEHSRNSTNIQKFEHKQLQPEKQGMPRSVHHRQHHKQISINKTKCRKETEMAMYFHLIIIYMVHAMKHIELNHQFDQNLEIVQQSSRDCLLFNFPDANQ